MAYVISSRHETVGFGDRIYALFKVMGLAMQRRRTYLQTLNELAGLEDRDLEDLGIQRNEIPTIAREAAYGV